MNYLPSKLSKLRKHYNYSQSYIAEYLNVDVIEYMNYENGSSMINYGQMKRLSSLYHISMTMMFLNSDEVDLYDVNNQNTDEINAKFFMPEKNFFNLFKGFVINHKIATGVISILLVAIFVLIYVIGGSGSTNEILKNDVNRLSVSDNSVVYIDDANNIAYTGLDNNGSLDSLTVSGPIKICEGLNFTVVLQEDGKVVTCGLQDNFANQISDWKNIVDIACGDNHVLGLDSKGKVHCVGSDKPCEIDGTKNIKKIFATANGSIAMNDVGSITYTGSFIGSSLLKDRYNIIDLYSSENILVILNNDNTLDVFDKSGSYLKAESWSDIVDVCCGDDFVAALDSYGKVYIEIENDEILEQVSEWSNIIAIDSGSDYLIGFDGNNIYGVGNNAYNQFKKETRRKTRLDKVSDIAYTLDGENINITFTGVDNASGYLIELNVGTGLSKRIEDVQEVSFSCENMIEGKYYSIIITSIGSGNYSNSDVSYLDFIYEKPDMINIDLNEYIGHDEKLLAKRLNELGIKYTKQISDDVVCDDNQIVIDIEGLEDGKYNKDSLSQLDVKYTCCKVE